MLAFSLVLIIPRERTQNAERTPISQPGMESLGILSFHYSRERSGFQPRRLSSVDAGVAIPIGPSAARG
jgi:hypothetical protein